MMSRPGSGSYVPPRVLLHLCPGLAHPPVIPVGKYGQQTALSHARSPFSTVNFCSFIFSSHKPQADSQACFLPRGGLHSGTPGGSQIQPAAADLWQGRINPHIGGLGAWGKSYVLARGMLVQSLGALGEGNITKRGIKALCSTPKSFATLCFIFHQKASPAQPSEGNREGSPVRRLRDASSQAVTEDSHGEQMWLNGCSTGRWGTSAAAKGGGQP